MKAKIEIKPFTNEEGETMNALYFNDEPFDWAVSPSQWWVAEASDRVTNMRAFVSMGHAFITALSMGIGKPLTWKNVIEAIEKGEMEI